MEKKMGMEHETETGLISGFIGKESHTIILESMYSYVIGASNKP